MLNALKKINNVIEKILLTFGTLCFIILVVVVLLQIATRLFIPITISWTEEVSRYLFLYMIAFVAPVSLRRRKLVFVDLLLSTLPKKVTFILRACSDLMVSVLSVIILFTAHNYILLGIGQIAPVTGLPMCIPYTMIFILSLFLSIFGISNFLEVFDKNMGAN